VLQNEGEITNGMAASEATMNAGAALLEERQFASAKAK